MTAAKKFALHVKAVPRAVLRSLAGPSPCVSSSPFLFCFVLHLQDFTMHLK